MQGPVTHPASRPLAILLTVSAPLTAAFFLGHVSRTMHAVIAPQIAVDLGLDATVLGLLSAVFYLTYGAVQLPLGLALDRFGPRRVQMVLLAAAMAGALVFAAAEGVMGLSVGRALIGLGMSASLMAILKGNATWWPRERLPLINGAALAVGGTGSMAATVPVEMLLRVVDWRGVFVLYAWLILAVVVLITAVAPDLPRPADGERRLTDNIRVLLRVYASPIFWRFAPAAALSTGTVFAIISLWIGPWLRDVDGLDLATAACYMFLVATMRVVGFIVTGAAMERLMRRGVSSVAVFAGLLVIFMLVQFALSLGLAGWALVIWAVFGVFSTVGNTAYSIYAQHFPAEAVGRVSTAQNLLVISVGFTIQAGIGVVIDFWPGESPGRYAPEGYHAAMRILFLLHAVALAWLIWPRRRARRR